MDLGRNLIQRVNVGDSLTRSAAAHPGHVAVVDGERRFTYAEFNRWVNRIANGLLGLGYARGDALGIASRNSAEYLAVYYACAKTGVVAVPVNLGWRPDEISYVLIALLFGETEMSPITTLFRPEHQLTHIGAVGTPLTDPRVSEVVVVGLPHERWTEAITAVVVPKEGATIDADTLLAGLKQRLAGVKVPKSVIVVDELPKTSTGKIQKNRVRADHAAHYES